MQIQICNGKYVWPPSITQMYSTISHYLDVSSGLLLELNLDQMNSPGSYCIHCSNNIFHSSKLLCHCIHGSYQHKQYLCTYILR